MDIKLFIDGLKRDKARGNIAPHQIVKLYSPPSLKQEFSLDELIKEFDLNWNRYDFLFISKNRNLGLPLKALYNKGLLTLDMHQPINDYRNIPEISQKIKKISLNHELIMFLREVDLSQLENRIAL